MSHTTGIDHITAGQPGGHLLHDMLWLLLSALASGLGGGLLLGFCVLLLSPEVMAEAVEQNPAALRLMQPEEVQRGSLLLKLASGGGLVDAPMVKTDVGMRISGMLARVRVSQQFHNPGREWVEGVYVFPLPEDAVVDRLRMRIGERVIEGEIQEKAQARRTYERAKRAGKKASLLRQERPNIFTSKLANIAPGEKVTVEIEYQQSLHYDQGRFRVRFPMVVAPRYIPGLPVGAEDVQSFAGNGWALNTDQVPDASRITPPVVDSQAGKVNPVSIHVSLDAGFPLARLESPYHPIESMRDERGVHQIRLKEGVVPSDRDFELVWLPETGQAPHAALFSERWRDDRYGLLMVMPPVRDIGAAKQLPRELIFVVDTSGSMHGESIRQAREALKLALKRLTPQDRFNIIQFNGHTHALFGTALAAQPQNLQQALAYVEGLEAEGGTMMQPALVRALDGQDHEGLLRQVVFLTDGSVGNEKALFQTIEQRLGSSRLFTVGIGSAPNSFFMTRAARFGRGSFTYIGKVAEVREKMQALFAKLESPVLTNIQVSWSGGETVEMWPQRVPDLYLGEPVILAARMSGPVSEMVVEGRVNGKPWRRTLQLRGGGQNPGVHVLWARRKIAALMDERARGRPEPEVRTAVLEVALKHQLVSRYTSLVAVDKTPVRPKDKDLQTKPVPVNLPKGWNAGKVFGQLPQTATPALLHLLIGTFALLLSGLLRCRWRTA